MKRKNIKKITIIALAAALTLGAGSLAFADESSDILLAKGGQQMQGQRGGMMQSGTSGNATEPSEIKTSTLTQNSAEKLTADTANATTIVMSSSNNNVKISESGTYIVTGSCTDGNLAVKKGTTGVVLILKDLSLTSTTGAAVSLNKGTEVKVVIEGTVNLTDAEDIANEDADDFDGAALKAKAGSSVALTGSGTLNVNGSCKNGIKVSDLEDDDKADGYTEASFIIDGEDLTVNVTASNDGISSGTDLTIKSGTINVSAADDGIKADYILTIGEEGSNGPKINVSKSVEGIEGATINIYSGAIDVTSSDDAINAANSDLTGYTYSLNIMGGTINISSGADGIDSNGNVNILGGVTTIVKSASNGGEGGLDYEGSCYIAEGTFVNPYGTTMDSGKGSQGGMGGRDFSQFGGKGQQNWGTEQTPPDGVSTPTPDSGSDMPQMDGNGPRFGGGFGGKGQMGQRPEMNGEMPQLPEMGSEAPQDLPEMNGEMPQMPEKDKGGRQGSGSAPEGAETAPENTENSGDPSGSSESSESSSQPSANAGWFEKLVEFFARLFKKS